MLNEATIDDIRERYNAAERRKQLTRGSYDPRLGKPFRFVFFMTHLERCERIRQRFALHTERVEHALASPLTRFALESILAA